MPYYLHFYPMNSIYSEKIVFRLGILNCRFCPETDIISVYQNWCEYPEVEQTSQTSNNKPSETSIILDRFALLIIMMSYYCDVTLLFWGLKGDSSEHSKEFKASMASGEFESATDVCLSCSCCRFIPMEFHTPNGKPGL